MNITTKEAYDMGYSAYIYGRTIFQNPFQNGTAWWDWWNNGWKDAESNDYYGDDY